MIRVRALSAGYGSHQVLDGLDLDVRDGEILALIGPSGCGKTTFLSILASLHEPSGGTVERAGVTTATVFQRPTLMPWRTVLDNATFGLSCRGTLDPSARDRARAMLTEMRLGAHLDDHPHQLSEGMRQRVNLARALLVDPDVLLLDEPFSALDAMTKRDLMDELLRRWAARQRTLVLASHALEEVVYLADRVCVLSDRPARVARVIDVELPRPRAVGAQARLALLEQVEALDLALRSASGR